MALGVAPGWGNLPQGNFQPEIYSKNVLKYFRRAAVVEAITNTDYYGEISEMGDTVHIIKEPVVSVSDYTRGQTVNIQDLDDEATSLTVDQAKQFGFAVDDLENKQAHLNWEGLATSSGAYAIKNDYDKSVMSYMENQVSTSAPDNSLGSDSATAATGITAATGSMALGFNPGNISPLAVMSRMSLRLDEQDIPEEDRWFVATPAFYEILQDENSKLLDVDFSHDSDSKMRNGRISSGEVRGFKMYKSNNAPSTSSGATTSADCLMAGHMSAVATASQIAKTEVLRSERFFGDIVRGLHLYGRGVLRSEAMAKAFWQVGT